MKKIFLILFLIISFGVSIDDLGDKFIVNKTVLFCFSDNNCTSDLSILQNINMNTLKKGYFLVNISVYNNWIYDVRGVLWDSNPSYFEYVDGKYIKDGIVSKIKFSGIEKKDNLKGEFIFDFLPFGKNTTVMNISFSDIISELFGKFKSTVVNNVNLLTPYYNSETKTLDLELLRKGEKIYYVYKLKFKPEYYSYIKKKGLSFGKAFFILKTQSINVNPNKFTIDVCYPDNVELVRTIQLLLLNSNISREIHLSVDPIVNDEGEIISNSDINLENTTINLNYTCDINVYFNINNLLPGTYHSRIYIADKDGVFINEIPITINSYRYQSVDPNSKCYYVKPPSVGDLLIAPENKVNLFMVNNTVLNFKLDLLNTGNYLYKVNYYPVGCFGEVNSGTIYLYPGEIKKLFLNYSSDTSEVCEMDFDVYIDNKLIKTKKYYLNITRVIPDNKTDYELFNLNNNVSSNYPMIKFSIVNTGNSVFKSFYIDNAQSYNYCLNVFPESYCTVNVLVKNITKPLVFYINGVRKEFNLTNINFTDPSFVIDKTNISLPDTITIKNVGPLPSKLDIKVVNKSDLLKYLIVEIRNYSGEYGYFKLIDDKYPFVLGVVGKDNLPQGIVIQPNESISLKFDFNYKLYALDNNNPILSSINLRIGNNTITINKPSKLYLDNYSISEGLHIYLNNYDSAMYESLISTIFPDVGKLDKNKYNRYLFLFKNGVPIKSNFYLSDFDKFDYNIGSISNVFALCIEKDSPENCFESINKCGNGILDEGEDCDYNSVIYGCNKGYSCSRSCVCIKSNKTYSGNLYFDGSLYNLFGNNFTINTSYCDKIEFENYTYNNTSVNLTINYCLKKVSFSSISGNINQTLNNFYKVNTSYFGIGSLLYDTRSSGKIFLNFFNITINYLNGSVIILNNISDFDFKKSGILKIKSIGNPLHLLFNGTLTVKYGNLYDKVNGIFEYENNFSDLFFVLPNLKIVNNTIVFYDTNVFYNLLNTTTRFSILGTLVKVKKYVVFSNQINTLENNESLFYDNGNLCLLNQTNNILFTKSFTSIELDNKTYIYILSNLEDKKLSKKGTCPSYTGNILNIVNNSYGMLKSLGSNIDYYNCYYICLNISDFDSCILQKCDLISKYENVDFSINGKYRKKVKYNKYDVLSSLESIGYSESNPLKKYVFYNTSKIIIPPQKNKTKLELTVSPKSIYKKVVKGTTFSQIIDLKNTGEESINIKEIYISTSESEKMVTIENKPLGKLSQNQIFYLKIGVSTRDNTPEGIYKYTIHIVTDKLGEYVIPVTIEVIDDSTPIDNILDLEVHVDCSGGTLEDGTCVINKGMNYTITITTKIAEVKYFVAAGFELTSIVKNESTLPNGEKVTTYKITVKAKKNTTFTSPPVWVPKVSSYGSKVELGVTPPSSSMEVVESSKSGKPVVSSYNGITLKQVYYVSGIKEERMITSTVSSTTNIPGGYFDVTAIIRNKDPLRQIYNVNLDISSNLDYGFGGADCGKDLCIKGIPIKDEILGPGESITRKYRVYATYTTPLGTHTLNIKATGYVGTKLLSDSESVSFRVVSPPKLFIDANVVSGTPAIPHRPVVIKGVIRNEGDYPIYVSISSKETHNFQLDGDCKIANPKLGPHSLTEFVCTGETQYGGDGLIIFEVSGTFRGHTISNLKDVVIEGMKGADLAITPNNINIPDIRPGETYSILMNITNIGGVPLFVRLKFDNFTGNFTDKYNCSMSKWVSFKVLK